MDVLVLLLDDLLEQLHEAICLWLALQRFLQDLLEVCKVITEILLSIKAQDLANGVATQTILESASFYYLDSKNLSGLASTKLELPLPSLRWKKELLGYELTWLLLVLLCKHICAPCFFYLISQAFFGVLGSLKQVIDLSLTQVLNYLDRLQFFDKLLSFTLNGSLILYDFLNLLLFETPLHLCNDDFFSLCAHFVTILLTSHQLILVDKRHVVKPSDCSIVKSQLMISHIWVLGLHHNGKLRSLRSIKWMLILLNNRVGSVNLRQRDCLIASKPCFHIAIEDFICFAHRSFDQSSGVVFDFLLHPCVLSVGLKLWDVDVRQVNIVLTLLDCFYERVELLIIARGTLVYL